MPWSGRSQSDLVQIFPKILSHQPKCTEVGRIKGVKIGVTVIWIGSFALEARCTQGALPSPRRITTHNVIAQLGMYIPIKRGIKTVRKMLTKVENRLKNIRQKLANNKISKNFGAFGFLYNKIIKTDAYYFHTVKMS